MHLSLLHWGVQAVIELKTEVDVEEITEVVVHVTGGVQLDYQGGPSDGEVAGQTLQALQVPQLWPPALEGEHGVQVGGQGDQGAGHSYLPSLEESGRVPESAILYTALQEQAHLRLSVLTLVSSALKSIMMWLARQ